jgi:hypothetical protein
MPTLNVVGIEFEVPAGTIALPACEAAGSDFWPMGEATR